MSVNRQLWTRGRSPAWYEHDALSCPHAPAELQDWLLDSTSLTLRLKAQCAVKFEVRLYDQGWQRPMWNERRAWGMRDSGLALVRQVHLYCDGKPWVFARTIIPVKTLKGACRRLATLGNKPLGEMLFGEPAPVYRGKIEVARITDHQAIYQAAMRPLSVVERAASKRAGSKRAGSKRAGGVSSGSHDVIWGRRSVFYLREKPLLVSEIFLPAVTAG